MMMSGMGQTMVDLNFRMSVITGIDLDDWIISSVLAVQYVSL
jgi:hypothetical protein